jgi:NADH-ubiquinone oxidoreductase chain 6
MKNILLNLLALVAILSSVLVITAKNPVISVLYLISVFINTAGYLILIGIGFVGIAYILVYIGAITVLFLFVIMMINIKLVDILEVGREYTKNLPLALSIGFVFLYLIFAITSPSSVGSVGGANSIAQAHSLDNISGLQILTYPLDVLTNFNKLFLVFGAEGGNYLNESISNNFITIINSLLNPVALDVNFTSFTQIEMLGQGLYTYGAY